MYVLKRVYIATMSVTKAVFFAVSSCIHLVELSPVHLIFRSACVTLVPIVAALYAVVSLCLFFLKIPTKYLRKQRCHRSRRYQRSGHYDNCNYAIVSVVSLSPADKMQLTSTQ
jgi:hypothetical protein